MLNLSRLGLSAGTLLLFSAISPASFSQSITLDFNTDANGNDIVHGQVIDEEYLSLGVDIWADNVGGGPDLATVYSSSGTIPNNRDPDLRASWDGGNAANTDAGNLLIIQENSYRCGDGVCDRADDEGSRPAGSLYIDFNQAIESTSFDLVDVERPENTGANLSLLDSERNVIEGSTITFDSLAAEDSSISWGDNFYNSIQTIYFDALNLAREVFGLKFDLGGSGAVNNVKASYTQVPELDGAGAPTAFALLAALIALRGENRRSVKDWFKRKK